MSTPPPLHYAPVIFPRRQRTASGLVSRMTSEKGKRAQSRHRTRGKGARWRHPRGESRARGRWRRPSRLAVAQSGLGHSRARVNGFAFFPSREPSATLSSNTTSPSAKKKDRLRLLVTSSMMDAALTSPFYSSLSFESLLPGLFKARAERPQPQPQSATSLGPRSSGPSSASGSGSGGPRIVAGASSTHPPPLGPPLTSSQGEGEGMAKKHHGGQRKHKHAKGPKVRSQSSLSLSPLLPPHSCLPRAGPPPRQSLLCGVTGTVPVLSLR